jgi:hypothetical protein
MTMKWLEHFKENPSALDALLADMDAYRQSLLEELPNVVKSDRAPRLPILLAGLDFVDHLRVQLKAEMSEQKAKAAYKGRRP